MTRPRRALAAVAALAALAALALAVAPAQAATHMHDGGDAPTSGAEHAPTVTITGNAYAPTPLTALAGDRVTWRNDDLAQHVVVSEDDAFDSPRLARGDTWARTFATAGSFRYYCTIHPFMRGEVDAVPILLTAPSVPVPPGGQATLRGRAQAGVAAVTIERAGVAGGPPLVVVSAPVAADGTFAARVPVEAAGRWRARAGALVSSYVPIAILTHQRVMLGATPASPGVALDVRTVPPRPHARLVLERYWRERFAWRVVARTRLDARGRARLTLPRAAGARLQAVLAPGAGLPRSTSRIVRG